MLIIAMNEIKVTRKGRGRDDICKIYVNVPFKVIFSRVILVPTPWKVIQSNSFDTMNPCGLNFPCFVSKGLFMQESEL